MDYIRKKFLVLVLLSALSVVIYTSFVYLGLHYTTVVNGSLLNALVPVLIVLLSHFILSERLTLKKTIGLFLSLIGAAVLILHGHLEQVTGVALNEGSLLIFIAAVTWALFSVLIKKIPKVLPPLTFLYVTAIIGCVMLLPCCIGESLMGNTMPFDMPTALSVLYASLMSSILAFTFWSVGVHGVGPARASYFFNLLPVYSSLLAILVLGEHFYMYEAVGTILVFSGILFATVKFNVKAYVQVKSSV